MFENFVTFSDLLEEHLLYIIYEMFRHVAGLKIDNKEVEEGGFARRMEDVQGGCTRRMEDVQE